MLAFLLSAVAFLFLAYVGVIGFFALLGVWASFIDGIDHRRLVEHRASQQRADV